jgi:hypothetical protein
MPLSHTLPYFLPKGANVNVADASGSAATTPRYDRELGAASSTVTHVVGNPVVLAEWEALPYAREGSLLLQFLRGTLAPAPSFPPLVAAGRRASMASPALLSGSSSHGSAAA